MYEYTHYRRLTEIRSGVNKQKSNRLLSLWSSPGTAYSSIISTFLTFSAALSTSYQS